MRFKHIHNNPITLVNIGYSIHNFWRIPFDESHPYYHSVMCLYIYNSISHHDGCRLVHPDTWYYLFGSPIMTDAVWCIPTRGIIYSVLPSCRIPTRGIIYSVLPSCRMPFSASRHVVSFIRFSHHVGCRLVHPDTWYQLNAIRHQDGCRLVHPAKWDISSMPYAIMTDADWCIPPSGTLENFGVPS